MWPYPPPSRIGLDVDPRIQSLITAVEAGSPAARAGLARGDRLIAVAGQRIASASDLSSALHELADKSVRARVLYEREGQKREAKLVLSRGWKRADPLSFSWRPLKWGLVPAPGFGGELLDRRAQEALGLDADTFAFRVGYLVTWGDNQRFGHEARRAGLRTGDIVLSADRKDDFESVEHFHAWWRLMCEVGDTVDVEVLRKGERQVFRVRVLE